MRGPIFEKLLKKGVIRIEARESLQDLETMYELILEARGTDPARASEFDEHLALAILCKLRWPGKLRSYSLAVAKLKDHYRGIAEDEQLQAEFRWRISRSVRVASPQPNFRLRRIRDVFRPPPRGIRLDKPTH